MKTAIYKLLNVKVEIIEEKKGLYKIKPLEPGIHWIEATVAGPKLRDIRNKE